MSSAVEIRKLLEANPKQMPSEVVATLKKRGITVTPNQVSNEKTKLSKKLAPAKGLTNQKPAGGAHRNGDPPRAAVRAISPTEGILRMKHRVREKCEQAAKLEREAQVLRTEALEMVSAL